LLGYTAGQPQVNLAGQPQVNIQSQRNASEIATSRPPIAPKVNDSIRRCWVCQSEQHLSSTCPNKIPKSVEARIYNFNSSLAGNNDSRSELNDLNETCRYRKRFGHSIKNCFKLVNKNREGETESLKDTLWPPPTEFAFRAVDFEGVDTNGTSKRVYLSAIINNEPVSCMCDPGSDENFMPYDLVEPENIIEMSMNSYAANGTVIEILGHCRVSVQLVNQVTIVSDFLVSKRVACPMLGTA